MFRVPEYETELAARLAGESLLRPWQGGGVEQIGVRLVLQDSQLVLDRLVLVLLSPFYSSLLQDQLVTTLILPDLTAEELQADFSTVLQRYCTNTITEKSELIVKGVASSHLNSRTESDQDQVVISKLIMKKSHLGERPNPFITEPFLEPDVVLDIEENIFNPEQNKNFGKDLFICEWCAESFFGEKSIEQHVNSMHLSTVANDDTPDLKTTNSNASPDHSDSEKLHRLQ